MPTPSPTLDPVTFEVILHRLHQIAEEMGIKYMQTSGSPILVGAYDAASAICLPTGQLVAIGPYITTQANVIPVVVNSVRARCTTNPGIGPGDMFICNDPYLGNTHQPDVATVGPVFDDGELVAWVGASGHWLDVGGPEPGSFNTRANTVYDEGLRIPPTRIVEHGRVREDLVALVMNQIRDPLTELDMRGQFVANQAGVEGMRALIDTYGRATVTAAMEETIAFAERRMRQRLQSLPDGIWREVQYIDHDGHSRTPHKIVITMRKSGGTLVVDYTGTDAQASGGINCTLPGVRAATLSAMYILLAWDLPWNDGVARCLELIVPDGTLVSARHPAPVSMSTLSSIILSLGVCFSAISKMLASSGQYVDEAMANWCATTMAPGIIGPNDRGVYTFLGEASHFGAGCGARTYKDGVDTGGIIINTTASMPSIETTEAEYPVMYLFRRQLTDSGGPGRFRGGMTAGLALAPYHPGGPLESSFAGVGAEVPNSFGLAGGLPGAAVRYIRFTQSRIREQLAGGEQLPADLSEIDGELNFTFVNRSHADFPLDSVEYHNWQGGGGYGDPLDRDPKLVLSDIDSLAVSPQVAAEVYGVLLTDGMVDEAATTAKRRSIVEQRLRTGLPGSQVLAPLGLSLEEEPHRPRGKGALRYADSVEFDFDRDVAACLRCSHGLGKATEDFRYGCLVDVSSVRAAGPVRGDDYDQGRVLLRRYYCPRCGRQLEADVTMTGAPERGFRLAGPGANNAQQGTT